MFVWASGCSRLASLVGLARSQARLPSTILHGRVVLCPPHFGQPAPVAGLVRADTVTFTLGNAAPPRRRMEAHPRFRVFPRPVAVSG